MPGARSFAFDCAVDDQRGFLPGVAQRVDNSSPQIRLKRDALAMPDPSRTRVKHEASLRVLW